MTGEATINKPTLKLMQAIRQAMAGTESVQKRLDEFVAAIQSSMQVKILFMDFSAFLFYAAVVHWAF